MYHRLFRAVLTPSMVLRYTLSMSYPDSDLNETRKISVEIILGFLSWRELFKYLLWVCLYIIEIIFSNSQFFAQFLYLYNHKLNFEKIETILDAKTSSENFLVESLALSLIFKRGSKLEVGDCKANGSTLIRLLPSQLTLS